MASILWLASYPKSGNTWIRAFLVNLLTDFDEPVDINKMSALTAGDSQAHWYARLDPRPPTALGNAELARLRPRVHRLIAESKNETVLVKTHNALVAVAGVSMITLEVTAGAIYVVRNPLDVALSYAHHLGATLDDIIELMGRTGFETAASAMHVPEHQSDWSSHVKSWTQVANPGLHVVRYEDLKADPARRFGAVARFLGVATDNPARIEKAIRFSSFETLRKLEDKTGFVERTPVQDRFFRKGAVGEWRDKLSPAQVKRVVERHREQMLRFGYVPEGG
ncbi:MAG: sulfotransferase domain-containing protein [Alphaproteobacteria bacterium]